jgi:hypothetical protein
MDVRVDDHPKQPVSVQHNSPQKNQFRARRAKIGKRESSWNYRRGSALDGRIQ